MTGKPTPETPVEAAATPAEDDVTIDGGGEQADTIAEELAIEVDTSEIIAGAEATAGGDLAIVSGPEHRIAELEARVATLEEESKGNYDRFLRASADLENFRKRARRDQDEARVDARSRALREVLPVIDNLERALGHADRSADEGIVKGVELVLRQFEQALERCEVTGVEAMGKPFDPNFHEAISQVESADHQPGTIAQVLQRGYVIGGRLLRPSLVVVTRPPTPPAVVADEAEPVDAGDDPAPTGDSETEG